MNLHQANTQAALKEQNESQHRWEKIYDVLGPEVFYEQAKAITVNFKKLFRTDYEMSIWFMNRISLYNQK